MNNLAYKTYKAREKRLKKTQRFYDVLSLAMAFILYAAFKLATGL